MFTKIWIVCLLWKSAFKILTFYMGLKTECGLKYFGVKMKKKRKLVWKIQCRIVTDLRNSNKNLIFRRLHMAAEWLIFGTRDVFEQYWKHSLRLTLLNQIINFLRQVSFFNNTFTIFYMATVWVKLVNFCFCTSKEIIQINISLLSGFNKVLFLLNLDKSQYSMIYLD